MDTITATLRRERPQEGPGKITVMAVYEDFATGARVSECCRSLVRDLGGGSEVVRQMWLVNLLRLPQLRAIAAEDAASAEMVIVSLHDAKNFPIELKEWVELWLEHKGGRPTVLLALFDEDWSQEPSPLQTYLETGANRGGLSFFLQTYEVPAGQRY